MSNTTYRHITDKEKHDLKQKFSKLKLINNQEYCTQRNLHSHGYPYLLHYKKVVDFYPLHLQGKQFDEIDFISLSKSLSELQIHHIESHDTFRKIIKIQNLLKSYNVDYSLWGLAIKQYCLHHTVLSDFKKLKNYDTYDQVVAYLMHYHYFETYYNLKYRKLNDANVTMWLKFDPPKVKNKTDITRYYVEWIEKANQLPGGISKKLFFHIKRDMLARLKYTDEDKFELLEKINDYKNLLLMAKIMFSTRTDPDPRYFKKSEIVEIVEQDINSLEPKIIVMETNKEFFDNLISFDGYSLNNSKLYGNIKKYFPNIILYDTIFSILPMHLKGKDIGDIDWVNLDNDLKNFRFRGDPQPYNEQNKNIEINILLGIQNTLLYYNINYMLWGIILKHYCVDDDLLYYLKGLDTYDQVITCIFKYFDFEKYDIWHLKYISTPPKHDLTNLSRKNYYIKWVDKMEESYFHPESFNIIKTHMMKHCKKRDRSEIDKLTTWRELKSIILITSGSCTHRRVDLHIKKYTKKFYNKNIKNPYW